MFSGLKKLYSHAKKRTKPSTPDIDYAIPVEFIDSISMEPFNDPVMTRYGHIYCRVGLLTHLQNYPTDPLTGQKLALQDVYEVPSEVISNLIWFNGLLRRFNESKNPIEKRNIHREMTSLARGMATIKQTLIDKRRAIETIKENLKIDINNLAHINFWRNKGKGGDKIPEHVYNMMNVARNNYETVDQFLFALNQARYVSKTSRFFKNCFRDDITKQLYNADNENIKTLSFRV